MKEAGVISKVGKGLEGYNQYLKKGPYLPVLNFASWMYHTDLMQERMVQPQDEVRGGRMLVGLTQILPDNIYRWAMGSVPKNGEIVFRSKTTNAPLRIEFMNAYCVNFERLINASTGICSELLISPDEIIINGISFDNHWV